MSVGQIVALAMFGSVAIFGVVLTIHTRGFARGYEQGYKDAMLMFNRRFIKAGVKND